jgi:hypothetical protein
MVVLARSLMLSPIDVVSNSSLSSLMAGAPEGASFGPPPPEGLLRFGAACPTWPGLWLD